MLTRVERAGAARAAIERRGREELGLAHAVFTWSPADAIESVLAALDLAPGSRVALPFSAPPAAVEAVENAGLVTHAVRTAPESLQLSAPALLQALANAPIAAIVAWRPAGLPAPDDLRAALEGAMVPVIDALPRTAGTGVACLPGAVATCVVLADGPSPAALVATDDPRLAAFVGSARVTGPPLDRWAATTLAALRPGDAIGEARLAAGHELLVSTLDALPGGQTVRAGVTGWGGPPEVLVWLDSAASMEAFAARIAEVLAVEASVWRAQAPDHWVAHATEVDDPCARSVAVRLKLGPSAADIEAVAALGVDDLDPSRDPAISAAPARVAGRRVAHVHQGWPSRAAKRGIDVAAGSVLLAALSPVMAVVALLVWLRDGAPVIFRQVRVGRHGVPFEMLKFRTMVVEADERVGQILDQNERVGPLFKVAHDPRATGVGRVLRRTSLDELPQLLNVVRGTMSLVGPRPALPRERVHFPPELLVRECVRPGLTGLWQVAARDDASFDRYAELDLDYVRHHDLRRDVEILTRTPAAVLRTALRRPFGRG